MQMLLILPGRAHLSWIFYFSLYTGSSPSMYKCSYFLYIWETLWTRCPRLAWAPVSLPFTTNGLRSIVCAPWPQSFLFICSWSFPARLHPHHSTDGTLLEVTSDSDFKGFRLHLTHSVSNSQQMLTLFSTDVLHLFSSTDNTLPLSS